MSNGNRPTFAQREGAAPIPQQLKLKEISQEMRAYLWAAVHKDLQSSIGVGAMHAYLEDPWVTIMRDVHVFRKHQMAHTFSPDPGRVQRELSELYGSANYVWVLDFTEWLLQHRCCSPELKHDLAAALEQSRSAYRVFGTDTIVAITDETEAGSVSLAFAATESNEFAGARTHLRNAAKDLRNQKHPDSMRESIHAVEAVLQVLEPGTKFAAALNKVEGKLGIHGALKAGFASLYGFTSDEKGIRHSLGDISEADVAEEDAIYMLGACASFVSYLIAKSRKTAK